jgi:hypothetical protein
MTNRDLIRRHLAEIKAQLDSLDYTCQTEIIGEDARHLEADIKGATRQALWIEADKLEESYQLKPLYDRLKAISCTLRILRNNIDLSDKAIETALESCRIISAETEEVNEDDL